MTAYGRGVTTVRQLGMSLSRRAAAEEQHEKALHGREEHPASSYNQALPSPHTLDELALFLGRKPPRTESGVREVLLEGYARVYTSLPDAAGYRRR